MYSFLKKAQIFLQKTDKYKTDDLYNRMAIHNIFSDNECEYLQLMPYLKGKLYADYNIVYGQDNNTNQNGFQNRKKYRYK